MDETSDLVGRLRALESQPGAHVRRQPGQGEIPQNPQPDTVVPVPRRSRIFLRHGGEHGSFADLTLTAPIVRTDLT